MGIDLGTQGIKVGLVDSEGSIKGIASLSYPTQYPKPGWVEQNPKDWWQALTDCVQTVLQDTRIPGREVVSIGFSGHMHSLVVLDDNYTVLRPVIVWADERAEQEAVAIRHELGDGALKMIYNPITSSHTIAKILWLQNNEPSIVEKASVICFPKDYLRWRLTGEWATDPSDASGSLMYDIASGKWSTTLTAVVGMDPTKLPPILPSTQVAGALTPLAASQLGLKPGIPVVNGAGDLAAALVGSGVCREHLAAIVMGTAGQAMQMAAGDISDYLGKLYLFAHAIPGKLFGLGAVPSAGLSLSWLQQNVLCHGPEDDLLSYDSLDEMAARVPPGSDGLVFLPYLLGTGTPHLDPNARGAFIGLTPSHDQAALVRAVMEGVAFGLKENLELFGRRSSASGLEVRLAGGGARSRIWRQIVADVTGHPVRRLKCTEASALGAALLAAVGCGIFSDLVEAADQAVVVGELLTPDEKNHGFYQECFASYQDTYKALGQKAPFSL